jgi:DNA-binding NarL/FixJ family response regulator
MKDVRASTQNLLIVDDDDNFRMGLKETLAAVLNISIIEVSSAKAALEVLKTQHVSAILSDIKMPEMDGIEFVTCTRALGLLQPVIFITGHADKDSAIQALRLGAVEYIEKPFRTSELIQAVKKMFSQDEISQKEKLQSLGLSALQIDILDFILKGKSNREISSAVQLAEQTIKYHVGNLLTKFGAENRVVLRTKVWASLDKKN